jgi:amino acid permease
MWTAMSHVVTILIGSGVLAMAWSFAQLGWISSHIVVLIFFEFTYYISTFLVDCYRYLDLVTGVVYKEYIDVVCATLV